MQTTTSHSPNAASQRRSVVGTGAAESAAAVPGAGGILDRPLPKQRGEVSESAYLYLFSEVVQYCQTRAQTPDEFKERLAAVGHGMGLRCAELLAFRSTRLQRFTDLTEALKFVSSTAWKALFGKDADGLEKVTGSKSTCLFWLSFAFVLMQKHVKTHTQNTDYISDDSLLINKYVAKDASATCAAFVAGIVQGILDGASFVCCFLFFPSFLNHTMHHLTLPWKQRVKVTPVRYATNPNNTASAKTYIRVQAVGEDDEVLA